MVKTKDFSKLCRTEECIGCMACMNICSVNAITKSFDSKGFMYPNIDRSKCIDCGKCKAMCGNENKEDKRNKYYNKTQKIIGLKNRNEEIRQQSSSGGFFHLIAKYVLDNRGVVYGSIINEKILAQHSRGTSWEECIPMMGSKYIPSDLSEIYAYLIEDIRNNKLILFTGTPCQCYSIKKLLNFLHMSYDKLIFCEFLCHGVPSPVVFEDYKRVIEKKYGGKIIKFKFRDKEKIECPPSCRGMRSTVRISADFFKEIDVYDKEINDLFFNVFKFNYISRECCYKCKHTGYERRAGDITMADFWGCESMYPDFYDNKGISLVMLNSAKGEKLFDKIKEMANYIIVDADKCMQVSLKHPPHKPLFFDFFWFTYYRKGFQYVTHRYLTLHEYIDKFKSYINILKRMMVID